MAMRQRTQAYDRTLQPRSTLELAELLIPLDPELAEPLHRQLYRGIREAILSGRLAPGVRLPSTRRLAETLSVSRSTALFAFDQLVAEGFIRGAVGSGSFVTSPVSPPRLDPRSGSTTGPDPVNGGARLSTRGERLRHLPRGVPRKRADPRAFRPGVPPVDQFPLALWSRLAARRYRGVSSAHLYHGAAAGYRPLREAIAAYLAGSRGVRCDPESVFVLSSAQEAMEFACRVLLDPGDAAWLEDPCWAGAHGALIGAGARIVSVPVDEAGLNVDEGILRGPDARLVYLTPSHQFPLGVTLSLERRLRLLEWAAAHDSWILEDDYDSEYRYSGRSLNALQGLNDSGRVLYIGTFNKTIYPSLRLAYLVVPDALVDPMLAARRIGGQHAPTVEQGIVADFLAEGHYARHLHRMRAICRERRDALLTAASEGPDLLHFTHTETGLHVVGWLPPELTDRDASQAAERYDIEATPLSPMYLGPWARGGLVLGYASLTPEQIVAATRTLLQALRAVERAGA